MKSSLFAAAALLLFVFPLSLNAQRSSPNPTSSTPPSPAQAGKPAGTVMDSAHAQKPKELRHFLRAPDVLPGTLPAMRSPEYWAGQMKDPDGVVLSVARIGRMNNDFRHRLDHPETIDTAIQRWIRAKIDAYVGLYEGDQKLEAKSQGERRALVAELVKKQIAYMRKGEFGNMLGIVYGAKEIDAMEAEMNLAGVAGSDSLRYGIATEDQTLRIVPQLRPEYTGQPDKNRTRWDIWNLDVLPIGAPVTVLHRSASGGFLFVCSGNGYGWVAAEKIAFADRNEQAVFSDPQQFYVCTGDKVPFYSGAEARYVSGWFRMGTRLPAAGEHKILVPTRRIDGKLSVQTAWLAAGGETHRGFLPYTRRNVVTISFRLLDNIYDWTGAWLGRNHETALRDIFACFGFSLPATGELLMAYSPSVVKLPATEARTHQYETIMAQDPFLTLQVCSSGHSNLFLGRYNDTPMTYDTHGYTYTDSAGNSMDIRRSCVGTIAWPDYFLKQDVVLLTLK